MTTDFNDLEKESWTFASEYETVSDNIQIITNPGKFEAEPLYTPYFYNMALHSAHDDTVEADGDIYDIFNVTAHDRALFADLDNVKIVAIRYSEQGFVYAYSDPKFNQED